MKIAISTYYYLMKKLVFNNDLETFQAHKFTIHEVGNNLLQLAS